MSAYMFRCPNMGYLVRGQSDDPKPGVYEPVKCTACDEMHMVDPTSGEVLPEPKD
jgi:hypothetical protein